MTYKEWRRQVRRLIKDDPAYPVSIIRNSLKGLPQLHVQDCTTVTGMIGRLDELFDTTPDKDTLLAQFYSNTQLQSETTKEYYMRLLTLLKEICNVDAELAPQLSSRLRRVFWEGLSDAQLRATLHYKYDSACPAAELMKAVSKEEEKKKAKSSTSVTQVAESFSQLRVDGDKPRKKSVAFYQPPPGYALVCLRCNLPGHPESSCPQTPAGPPPTQPPLFAVSPLPGRQPAHTSLNYPQGHWDPNWQHPQQPPNVPIHNQTFRDNRGSNRRYNERYQRHHRHDNLNHPHPPQNHHQRQRSGPQMFNQTQQTLNPNAPLPGGRQ